MIDVATLLEASTRRRTYWRLNREHGAPFLDELLATHWEDFGHTSPYSDDGCFDSSINPTGMDDIFEFGGEENMWIDDTTSARHGGSSQATDTRDHGDEWYQWDLVEQALRADILTFERELEPLGDEPMGMGDEFGRIYWLTGDTTIVDRVPHVLTDDEVIEHHINDDIRTDLELERQALPPIEDCYAKWALHNANKIDIVGTWLYELPPCRWDVWEDVEMSTRYFHGKI